MVEYNKYDDLNEQQRISNICDSIVLSADTLSVQQSNEHETFIKSICGAASSSADQRCMIRSISV